MKNIIKIMISLILLNYFIPAFSKHNNPEFYYQNKWCVANNGITEYKLTDNARVDCLTKDYAVEFDFATKWAESIGQALYYANVTHKKPAVVLIMEVPEKEQQYLNCLNNVAKKYKIKVFIMQN